MTTALLSLALSLAGQASTNAPACPLRVEVRDGSGAALPGATVVDSASAVVIGVAGEDGVVCVAPARPVRVELGGFVTAEVLPPDGPPSVATTTVVLAPAFRADVEVAAARRDARLRDAPV